MKNTKMKINWTRHDIAMDMPRRFNRAMHKAKETLPALIRSGLVLFTESIEETGIRDYPRFSSMRASKEA
jgi:hypothetical protein